MTEGIPYAGILFLLVLYNGVLYFLWGIYRWRERVSWLPFLLLSSGFLAALYLLRAVWALIRGELAPAFFLYAVLWLLGLVCVNTLLGGILFLAVRGFSRPMEGGLAIPPESAVEAPPSTWVLKESEPRGEGQEPPGTDPGTPRD